MASTNSTKKQPFFSVVIPAYNEEKYLATCLRALFQQQLSRQYYEVIVVDNGSDDSTMVIAQSFPVRIVEEKRKGVVFARQAGLLAARGRYLVSNDADTVATPDWLAKLYRILKADPSLVAVAGMSYSKGKDLASRIILPGANLVNWWHYQIFRSPLGVVANNLAVQRKVLISIGGYNTDLPHFGDQLELWSRLRKAGKTKLVPEITMQESDRRYGRRSMDFIIKDVLYYCYLNYFYYRLTKKHFGNWQHYR
jgi:glycosyltransferase involved in cell wall biosynthesis